MPPQLRARPELLSPAGDWECLRAAIENGADAVYFGLDHGFNARARAANFPLDELHKVVEFLHRRGVKGYVTLNTLVFSTELAAAEDTIRSVAAAGTDAVLVQDLGLMRLIREVTPDLPIHASTQMTLTSAESIRMAQNLGAERVVLARELSVDEIRIIHRQTEMPLEVFVHGALCVAYSGQCLTSESLGGRSANRGQCAQACRLPYELYCDNQQVDLGDVKYLLSPQDLAAYELTAELIDAGAMAFKIEGRLKTPEYVANITRHYRAAIDAAMSGRRHEFSPQDVEEMELSFSRGFSPGWLQGCDHKMLVPGLSSAKRGVLLGEVTQVRSGRVQVKLESAVKPGDGIVFEGDRSQHAEQGGRVFAVYQRGRRLDRAASQSRVELTFGKSNVDLGQLWVGQKIWKTDDPELTRKLRKTFHSADPLRKVPIDLRVRAAVGEKLFVCCQTENGIRCEISSDESVAKAERLQADEQLFRTQLGRLGGTPFELRQLTAEIVDGPMVPLSVLGRLRHALVARLEELSIAPPLRRINSFSCVGALRSRRASEEDTKQSSTLHVLCRNLAQLDAVLDDGMRNVYVDFQDIREYRAAVERAHQDDAVIYLAMPRIEKPRETGLFRALLKYNADGILVRNLGGLAFYSRNGVPLTCDFSLNAANDLTVDYLLASGAQRVTPSYDLNREQLSELVRHSPAGRLEVVVHQHMPMFHMEHCVFCAVLSPGTNKTNCGRPCDRHDVKLRDRIGMDHPLTADVGCRNTLFNAVPQSAAEAVPALIADGIRHFRVELLQESAVEIATILNLYQQLLSGKVAGKEVWRQLRATNRVGVTRGTLEERRNPLAIL